MTNRMQTRRATDCSKFIRTGWWRGNAFDPINKVTVRRARLVL